MTLGETLIEVWRQALVEDRAAVEIQGKRLPVTRTRSKALRTVSVAHGEHRIECIEQNPETKSRWAALARDGKKIMQFRVRGKYIGNVCEGTLMRYPSWKALQIDE